MPFDIARFIRHSLVAVACLVVCHVTAPIQKGLCENDHDTEWRKDSGFGRLAAEPSNNEAGNPTKDDESSWTSLLQMGASLLPLEASSISQTAPQSPAVLYNSAEQTNMSVSIKQNFIYSIAGAIEQARNLYFDPFGGSGFDKVISPDLAKSEKVIKRHANFTGVEHDITEDPQEAMKRVQDVWTKDMFPATSQKRDGDEGLNFFKSAPPTEWLILGSTCAILSMVDLLVWQSLPDTFTVHLSALCFWICMAMAFCTLLWYRTSQCMALDWFTGYVLEWILSMDNLFVFHLVLSTYKTPPKLIHKAVFIGIIGAVLIRMAFFMVVSTLLHISYWIRIPFGLLLIWSGVEAARGNDEDDDPEALKETFMVRTMRWMLGQRLMEGYDEKGNRMFVTGGNGQLQVTLLFFVVLCLEATDVLFALDSVSAKVAQIPDQYIAFSSSVLAMYGLRAMFFIVKDLVEMFELLQYGLCLILVFIGIELILANYIHLAPTTVCILVVSVFAVCITGSAAVKCGRGRHPVSASGTSCSIVSQ